MSTEDIFKSEHTIYVKNLFSRCCIRLIKNELAKLPIENIGVFPGYIIVNFNQKKIKLSEIERILENNGFSIIKTREERIVSQIKQAVFELIHEMNNVDSIARKSEYIVEKIGLSYQHLSKIFSKHEDITLEKYIIRNKIERIKELIDSNEYTLSEIAYMMDYSSVQYLSNQFKKETGISVSEYKNMNVKPRKFFEDI